MKTIALILVQSAALAVLLAATTGCYHVNAGVTTVDDNPGAAPAAVAADDHRSIAELQRDNAVLRDRLSKQEAAYTAWQSGRDKRADEIKNLKRQLDDLKDDRDKYKKLAKKAGANVD
jgi:flagellar motility protein MotE (MotC chaperone)